MPPLHSRSMITRTAAALTTTTVVASLAASAPATASTVTTPTAPSAATSRPFAAANALDQVTTPSRVKTTTTGAVRYTWPGSYFEGRFRGTGVGLVLDDTGNDYTVQVDGATIATLVNPGKTTYWVKNLTNGTHSVRLAKRTESPWAAGEFGGLVAATGGAILAKPAQRTRQIEFIGDSWTAGYGDTSTTRDCSTNGGVTRNTNADVTFGALTAQKLGADYQILAQSGLGIVRNYNGQSPDTNYRTGYEQTLQSVSGSTEWQNPATWKPQVIVIGLGINDFSTDLNSGEKWATEAALAADYQTSYLAFLDKLRTRYGTDPYLVLTYPDLSYRTTAFADSIKKIVQTRTSKGDTRVGSLYYDDNALGLDKLGCDWHPSSHDHKILASTLTDYITALSPRW